MRTRILTGLVLAMGLAAPAFAESPFVGRWTATAAAPTGPASETLTVVKTGDGYAVTAKLVSPTPGQPEASPGKDIMLDGDHFSYKRTLVFSGSEIVITYTGVVSGDMFTGEVQIGQFARYVYTGVRIKDGG